MKALMFAALIVTVTANANEVTHGVCSPNVGSIGGNAVVNICPGEQFASAQEALLIASHPTTVVVTDLRFKTWFEDKLTPFLTVALKNKSDVPAIAVSVDVMNLKSGATYSRLKPLRVHESGVFMRLGSKAVSIGPGGNGDYPLFSVQDLLEVVHPEVPRTFLPL